MIKIFLLLCTSTKLSSIDYHLVNIKFIKANEKGSIIRIDSKSVADLALYCVNMGSYLVDIFNTEYECSEALKDIGL